MCFPHIGAIPQLTALFPTLSPGLIPKYFVCHTYNISPRGGSDAMGPSLISGVSVAPQSGCCERPHFHADSGSGWANVRCEWGESDGVWWNKGDGAPQPASLPLSFSATGSSARPGCVAESRRGTRWATRFRLRNWELENAPESSGASANGFHDVVGIPWDQRGPQDLERPRQYR